MDNLSWHSLPTCALCSFISHEKISLLNVSFKIVHSRFRSKRSKSIYFTLFSLQLYTPYRIHFILIYYTRRKMRRWILHLFSCTTTLLSMSQWRWRKISINNRHSLKRFLNQSICTFHRWFQTNYKEYLRLVRKFILLQMHNIIFQYFNIHFFLWMDKYFNVIWNVNCFCPMLIFCHFTYIFLVQEKLWAFRTNVAM